MENRFYSLNQYFKSRYHERVQKITINSGFSCPNLDGTLSNTGCIYCNNLAFNPQLREDKEKSIRAQIEEGMEFAYRRYNAKKFMAYYQPYSNTYAPVELLREKYKIINEYSKIVALSIGTRPDCVNKEKLNLIASFKNSKEVWIEYGLQSAKEETLKKINRGHDFEDFKRSVLETKKRNIKVCVHLIVGLPGESFIDYLHTATKISKLKVDGVKLHPAHVVKNTELAKWYQKGKYNPLSYQEYLSAVTKMVEYLPSHCVIQRMGASAPSDLLLAPEWINEKKNISSEVNKLLNKKGGYQGKKNETRK